MSKSLSIRLLFSLAPKHRMRFVHLLALFLTVLPISSKHIPNSGWTELAPIGRGPRQEEAVTALGTDVYIIGGIPQELPYPTLNWVEVYSTVTDQWRDAAPLPTTINHGNVATINGKIYILGGLNGTNVWNPIGSCYEYDPRDNIWKTLPSMPNGQARGASAVGVHGSTIYLAGGLLSLNLITGAQPTLATVTSYNVKTQEWTTLPSLPEGRDHVGGVVIGDIFYVVGGRVNGVPNVRNTVFAMDVTSPDMAWVEKATMPTARGGLSTAALGSRIYTFGGEGSTAVVPNGVYDNVEVYDTVYDTWETLPPMPFPRHGTNAVAVGSQLHIPGGGNVTAAGPQARNDFYQPSGRVW